MQTKKFQKLFGCISQKFSKIFENFLGLKKVLGTDTKDISQFIRCQRYGHMGYIVIIRISC